MDLTYTIYLLLASLALWAYFHVPRSRKLPPGPFPLPFLGNILQLGQNPHRSLTELAKTYGPIIYLKLGSVDTIVVSSPELAKEILQKHDQVCSSRPIPEAIRPLDHHQASIAWLPYGNRWRLFRKICRENLFSTHRLDESQSLRREKLQQLCDHLYQCCDEGRVVNVGEVAFTTSLNLMSNTFFSIDSAEFDSDFAQEMKGIIQSLMKNFGKPNLADYFPVLKWFDPQGIKRDSRVYFERLLAILDEKVGERLCSTGNSKKNDMLEALIHLDQKNASDFSHKDISHLLLDLLIGGADTSSIAVEWAIAELLHHPEKMFKIKEELRTVIGENKHIEESDISNLPYLNAVIKETIRCHPGPFLMPHKADADVEINGYIVPKNAQLLVNVWAITRDPSIWSNPDSFEPERFLDSKIDYKGHDFELILFGSGRRMCPGLPLAHRMVHLMLGTLVHNFDWRLESGLSPQDMDMTDRFGLVLHKVEPLKVIPSRV